MRGWAALQKLLDTSSSTHEACCLLTVRSSLFSGQPRERCCIVCRNPKEGSGLLIFHNGLFVMRLQGLFFLHLKGNRQRYIGRVMRISHRRKEKGRGLVSCSFHISVPMMSEIYKLNRTEIFCEDKHFVFYFLRHTLQAIHITCAHVSDSTLTRSFALQT